MDIGVASSVVALSSAGCVPFSSCNGGAFGGSHDEDHPLVAFYTLPEMVELLLETAQEANVGLENEDEGSLLLYADDIRNMRNYANGLINKRALFRKVK